MRHLIGVLLVLLDLHPLAAYSGDLSDQKTLSGAAGKSLSSSAKGQVSRFIAKYSLATSLTCTAMCGPSDFLSAS